MRTEIQFEAIVAEHSPLVFRTLARILGSRENLEDLAQEVFLRLYRALPAFRGEALISTYLYRIVINVAKDELKRKIREEKPLHSISDEDEGWNERLAHPSLNAEQELEQREFSEMVNAELEQLSLVEKTVLILYHQEERSYEQIAEVLRMPMGTVRTHLHRGRKKLKTAIDTRMSQEVRR